MTEVTFIQVGDLADGFELESNLMPFSDALVGQHFQLFFPKQATLSLTIDTKETLSFDTHANIVYRCTNLREGIYFIDFLNPLDSRGTVSIIIDLLTHLVTLVYGQLPTYEQVELSSFKRITQKLPLTDVNVTVLFGTLKASQTDTPLHHFTDELIGYRNQYIYSATEKYEHIYLNENFYAWHCIEGVEKGLADVDRCHYIKISKNLYLFIWREKIVPTLGIILIDMDLLRTDGKIVGYQEADFKVLSNFQVGSYASVLNIQSVN